MWSHFKKFDWILIVVVALLCAISSLTLLAIDAGNQTSNFFYRQIIFIGLGFLVMVGLSFMDYRILKNQPKVLLFLYLGMLVILALVLFFGREVRGAASWFNFGAFNFEPVELAKIIIVLVLAKYFSNRHVEVYRIRHIIVSAIYVGLPIALVLLQPDLGSVMILVALWLGMVILSGIKPRHLLLVILCGALIFSLAWAVALKPYQKERISTFLNPAKDPLGYSYNLIQSKIAIGSGGLWGRGLGHGTQGQLNFLPEKHTDFIFAIFAEEWGLLGVLFLSAVFFIFFWRLIKLILSCGNNFFRLFVAGFTLMVFVQIFINMGMNLGLLPITGISLPFVSYGGSNLLINFIALGIVQGIAIQTKSSMMENIH